MTRPARSTRWLPLFAFAAGLATATACDTQAPTEDPIDPPSRPGPVLVLGDERTEDSVAAILTRAGIEVEVGGPYWEHSGDGLDGFSAVVFLTGFAWARRMPEAAQSKLVAFVANGGGLMTVEWLLYNHYYDSGFQDLVGAIAPAKYAGDYAYSGETYSRTADHPVAAGLPQSFALPADGWSYSLTTADPDPAKAAQVVFRGSASGDAVVAGRHGQGRTVHWNMAGEYQQRSAIWSAEVRQLLVNIVKFVSKRS
jgi:hypothetical protein